MDAPIFKSTTRPTGDMAGIFEHDGEVGFFYLFDLSREKGKQIAGSLFVNSEGPGFSEADVSIKWSNAQEAVGLYIHGRLWAALDLKGKKFGGYYGQGKLPDIPEEVLAKFHSL